MKPSMSSFSSQGYALMRIVAGFLFLWHGAQKLFGIPSAMPAGVPAFIIYGAGPIELICGILVMIGLFTRQAAFLASGLMAFAYWMAHGTQALLPIQNKGELAALYCFVFLFISTQGGGIWSVDAAQNRR
jgi:putative oxidoreductase